MNAKELIQLLQRVPPEMTIVIRGYEEGYNDIRKLKHIKIKIDPKAKWYYGEYLKSQEPDAIEAIELFGENNKEEQN